MAHEFCTASSIRWDTANTHIARRRLKLCGAFLGGIAVCLTTKFLEKLLITPNVQLCFPDCLASL